MPTRVEAKTRLAESPVNGVNFDRGAESCESGGGSFSVPIQMSVPHKSVPFSSLPKANAWQSFAGPFVRLN